MKLEISIVNIRQHKKLSEKEVNEAVIYLFILICFL